MSDPQLRVNLTSSVHALLNYLRSCPDNEISCVKAQLAVLEGQIQPIHPTSSLLDCLSQILLVPYFTLTTARLFRPILLDLTARWSRIRIQVHLSPLKRSIDDQKKALLSEESTSFNEIAEVNNERIYYAFSILLPIAPSLKSLAVKVLPPDNLLYSTTLFQDFKNKSKLERLQSFCLAIYRLVKLAPGEFVSVESIPLLQNLLGANDAAVTTYVTHIISMILGLSDLESHGFFDKFKPQNVSFQNHDLLWLIEEERIAMEKKFLLSNEHFTDGLTFEDLNPHLSNATSNICGVLMLRESNSKDSAQNSELVLTPTTYSNLHNVALNVGIGAPVLLEGPPGSGKTSLVEDLKRKLSNIKDSKEIIRIHLGSQTDSKVLLGTYVCTSTPGSFMWKPGVLTTAVQQGRWVLIEDIDMAPNDVLSILIPLLESQHLFIPSRGEKVKAHNDFQLFATRTTHMNEKSIWANSPGSNLWNKVKVVPLQSEELATVLKAKFPILQHLTETILQLYEDIINKSTMYRTYQKPLSHRDLFKFCYRVCEILKKTNYEQDIQAGFSHSNALEEKARYNIFYESVDCFCAMIPQLESRKAIMHLIGNVLNIPDQRIDYFINNYDPVMEMNEKQSLLYIGRAILQPLPKKLNAQSTASTFAHTCMTKQMLERVGVCVSLKEPVLLVGETGTGKTTSIQHLAHIMNQTLIAVNLSQQTDSSDLLGGFKPVDIHSFARPLKETFDELFPKTFSARKNIKFIEVANRLFLAQKWEKLIQIYKQAFSLAGKKLSEPNNASDADCQAKKISSNGNLLGKWKSFLTSVQGFETAIQKSGNLESKFLFSFVEGSLVKAVRRGHWILLDEVNLASTETLECLSSLLQSAEGSILLTERGDYEPIKRHPNFRIFACMNPATDVGKKDLPRGLRSRFTEFYVDSPDMFIRDLTLIVNQYLSQVISEPVEKGIMCKDIVDFYMKAKAASLTSLSDGANQRPHFSMRTLTRALNYACTISSVYGLRRSLYEGLCMSFGTQLSKASSQAIVSMVTAHIFRNTKKAMSIIKSIPKAPEVPNSHPGYVCFDCFWLEKGTTGVEVNEEVLASTYILTPSIQTNLRNLARVVISRKYPVLLQGPTSSGKTSMVEYLAKRTGHRFVRINNHEHTDIQEYLGTYVTNSSGQLVFQEGILVQALRHGYWIVLDELNLAPSDVLEALNRLLDDNRELLIPETQEIVRPHPHFMLFATQNPAGAQYGGRKPLSRAFRNRFLELHFEDIPATELKLILERRCQIPPSYATLLIKVYDELIQYRQGSRLFDGKHGFITLRDLFRWASRYDDDRTLFAFDGYLLLAERIRKPEDKIIVKSTIEKIMKVDINENDMYDAICNSLKDFEEYHRILQSSTPPSLLHDVVWTSAMKRLFALVSRSIKHSEPVLLVGETGCGKTTICQMLSIIRNQKIHILNCQQNTETADFLGGQRPVRNRGELLTAVKKDIIEFNGQFRLTEELPLLVDMALEDIIVLLENLKLNSVEDKEIKALEKITEKAKRARALFEWYDGPLVQAIKQGDLFLLDEISLADDSVLERLNSLLEPQRLLVLAEKAAMNPEDHIDHLFADTNFQFFATMNPGGDYGKKELSPALRNRFTEIWVPSISNETDLAEIIQSHLAESLQNMNIPTHILSFMKWYSLKLNPGLSAACLDAFSLRDILSWVQFMNSTVGDLGCFQSFVHGGSMVLIDRLGTSISSSAKLQEDCLSQLCEIGKCLDGFAMISFNGNLHIDETIFKIGQFSISRGSMPIKKLNFTLNSPTTNKNALRVLRAMQLSKPILLEGSPGVGKTSLIQALSEACGMNLVRINLSEQTDLMDLFGTDLPVENGKAGEFCWKDGPFLQAMQNGQWVLLDEINLASQSVLEGLNACLDHRGEIYVPELDMTFHSSPSFRIFAAQNPLKEGGGRKGLPKSFLNRFTQVYIHALTTEDLLFISKSMYPEMKEEILEKMIEFNSRMHHETMIKLSFGRQGSPWEFNLRDVFRWIELVLSSKSHSKYNCPEAYVNMVYVQRMRTEKDRLKVQELFNDIFQKDLILDENPSYFISPSTVTVGNAILLRENSEHAFLQFSNENLELLQSMLQPLQSVMKCVEMSWMTILEGPVSSGKTKLIRLLAKLTGNKLEEFAMNSSIDTMELLGGFEQVDLMRHEQVVMDCLHSLIRNVMKVSLLKGDPRSSEVTQNLKSISEKWKNLKLYASSNETEAIRYTRVVKAMYEVIETCEFIAKTIELEETDLEIDYSLLRKKVTDFNQLCIEPVSGRFEWTNGVLINALKNGNWVLIDNANFCSPSVLDRLNPLLEPNGKLMVNERGLVQGEIEIIKPHKNFRLFLTLDPANGELSRAMRNRGIEIALLPSNWNLNDSHDAVQVMKSLGLPGDQLPRMLAAYHSRVGECIQKLSTYAPNVTTRDFFAFGKMVSHRLSQGYVIESSVNLSLKDIYGESFTNEEMNGLPDDFYEVTTEPGFFPYPINSQLHFHHSSLAKVLLDASYFLHLLHKYAAKEEKVPIGFIQGAADYIIKMATFRDWKLRLSLLQHAMANVPGISHLDVAGLCLLLKQVFSSKIMTGLQSQFGNIHLDFMPLSCDMVTVQEFFSTSERIERYCDYSKALRIMLHVLKFKHNREKSIEEAHFKKIAELSVFQQVLCFQSGRIEESQLQHKVLTLVPIFMTEFEDCMEDTLLIYLNEHREIVEKDFLLLLDYQRSLWEILENSKFSLDRFSAVFRRFTKLSCDLLPQDCKLQSVMESMQNMLPMSASKALRLLWKKLHPITLKSQELLKLEGTFQESSNILKNVHHGECSVLDINLEARKVLLEGAATLYYLNENENTEKSQLLYQSLLEIPKHVTCTLLNTPDQVTIPVYKSLIPLLSFDLSLNELRLLKQLNEIVILGGSLESLISKFKKFLHQSLRGSSQSTLDLVPYQRLLWLLQFVKEAMDESTSGKIVRLMYEAQLKFFSKLWGPSYSKVNENESPENKFADPSKLYQGVYSEVVFREISNASEMSIQEFSAKLKELLGLKAIVQSQFHSENTEDAECSLLVTTMIKQFANFKKVYNSEHLVTIHEFFIGLLAKHQKVESQKFDVNILSKSTNSVINKNMDKYIADIAREMSGSNEWRTSSLKRGYYWISLGLFLLNILSPDSDFDPATKDIMELERVNKRITQISEEIECLKQIEKLVTGNSSNSYISQLEVFLEECKCTRGQKLQHIVNRPEHTQFLDLRNDIHQMRANILRDEYICNLYCQFSSSLQSFDSVIKKEEMIQDNLGAFIARIQSKYSDYRDFVDPLSLAVHYVRFGLRIGIADRKKDKIHRACQLVSSLMKFPTAIHSGIICRKDVVSVIEQPKIALDFSFVLLRQLAARALSEGNISTTTLFAVEDIFVQVLSIWKKAEAIRKQKIKEEVDLYKFKGKTQELLSDEDLEEQEMKILFPDYYEDFSIQDLEDNNPTPMDDSLDSLKVDGFTFSPEDLWEIKTIHEYLFSSESFDGYCHQHDVQLLENSEKDLFHSTYCASMNLCRDFTDPLPLYIDQSSMHLHSYSLSRVLNNECNFISKQHPSLSARVQNFNNQSNISESYLLYEVVERLQKRIFQILEIYPEHSVLLTIEHLCQKVIKLPVSSPLAKLLVGLELLLQKSQDWKNIASKEFSIDPELDGLTELIVKWRKLELQSWSTLLDSQLITFQDVSLEWWFHLYETLIGSWPLGSDHIQVEKDYFENLAKTIEEFLQSSKVGEFNPKIQLLNNFKLHVKTRFRVSGGQNAVRDQLVSVLENMIHYYDQFSPIAQDYLDSLRKPIEKEIKEFTKIASWRDVNFESLKQSTYKSHRQLARLVRKFKTVLQEPFYLHIAREVDRPIPINTNINVKMEFSELIQSININHSRFLISSPSSTSKLIYPESKRVQNIYSIGNRMREFCDKDLILMNSNVQGLTLDQTTMEILSRISVLREMTIPESNDNEEKKKHIMHQKSVKKRALVDLFKLLSKLGLSYRKGLNNVKPTSEFWISPFPKFDLLSLDKQLLTKDYSLWSLESTITLWTKGNEYYNKLCLKINGMRVAALKCSQDVTPTDAEKAKGFVEHLFNLVQDTRSQLSHISGAVGYLEAFLDSSINRSSESKLYSPHILRQLKGIVDITALSLADIKVIGMEVDNENIRSMAMKKLEECYSCLYEVKPSIDGLFNQFIRSNELYDIPEKPIHDEGAKVMFKAKESLQLIYGELEGLSTYGEYLSTLIEPLLTYLKEVVPGINIVPIIQKQPPPEAVKALDLVIETCMISVQELVKMKQQQNQFAEMVDSKLDVEEDDKALENYISSANSHFKTLFNKMDVFNIVDTLHKLQQCEEVTFSELLYHCQPMVHQYTLLLSKYLFDFMAYHKSLVKFTYVLCNTAHQLFINGLCLPVIEIPDDSEGGEQGGGGLGIAEGTGSKDVSDEIEDEEQVLGTQNDKPEEPSNRPDSNDRDTGIEMENEFEGELEDVDPPSNEEEEKESEAEDLDDQMGDLDSKDPNVIDEKMWEGEDKDEDQSDNENNANEGDEDRLDMTAKGEKETVAKEPEPENALKNKPKKVENKPMSEDDSLSDNEEQDSPETNDNESEENDFPEADREDGLSSDENEEGLGKPTQDAEDNQDDNLELPDELNLDENDDQTLKEDDHNMSDASDDDEDGMDIDQPEDTKHDDLEESNMEDSNDGGAQQIQPEVLEEEKPETGEEPSQTTSNDTPTSIAPHGGDNGQSGDLNADEPNAPMPINENNDSTQPSQQKTVGSSGHTESQPHQHDDKLETSQQDVNPHRSLGDVLKEWKKRLSVKDSDTEQNRDSEDHETPQQNLNLNLDQQFEYIKQDSNVEEDAQALGVADEEQVQPDILDNEKMQTNDEQPSNEHHGTEEEDDMKVDEPPLQAQNSTKIGDLERKKDEIEVNNGTLNSNSKDESEEEEDESAKSNSLHFPPDSLHIQSHHSDNNLTKEGEVMTLEEVQELRCRLEKAIQNVQAHSMDMDTAKQLWQSCERIVNELSQELSEQLRLIMEPTLCTKYRGDYRTGKRLNMKRIIPYVASQFKKDKIWLRRTKPSKRQYQVLIAVDDSKSMSESHAVQLTYESLALISKALSRLEVGEVAIATFGSDMNVLHPFEEAFTDDSGANVIGNFSFSQTVTNVKSLMESSLVFLEQARRSTSSSSELWQLEIILSDGLCQHHQDIQSLVRLAAEKKVMLIFIIIDRRSEKESLLQMKSVSYNTDASGKLQMNMTRYMDSFPFEYFILLRDINSLPQVLADALRQYFMFVNSGREI